MAKIIQVPYPTKRYFTNEDHANLIYFQFPKLLMYGDTYKSMSSDSKLLYMLCLDLIKLSMRKNWKDEYGRYYIKLSVETIKDRLNCQNTKAINLKKELINHELMEVVRVGQGKADRLYILQLDYSEEDIYKANNDHEDIENDEIAPEENVGALGAVENSDFQNSRIPKSRTLEFRKSEPIKNDFTKNNSTENNFNKHNKDSIDDDKRTLGGDSSVHNEQQINLLISNFRESTKDDLSERSFKAIVRKVMDKYNQGKVDSLRDYLATALANKIDELELRRAKSEAKEQLKANSPARIHEKKQELENQPIRKKVPFYNWLED
ncbi:hypothetical protein CN378_12710 [Bacillus sp. AFS015802]|uniref:replication initiator protein A n=1 Tax=Bacillus sp. AFS015802 TaxID=2033486 RepID=UPI000BF53025|nr:replication initiator protein A [Bacillus sp. AFS015802]PFA66868.1 hypothetical protein CN378_12710 [Bacillus sp. AFS015802]